VIALSAIKVIALSKTTMIAFLSLINKIGDRPLLSYPKQRSHLHHPNLHLLNRTLSNQSNRTFKSQKDRGFSLINKITVIALSKAKVITILKFNQQEDSDRPNVNPPN
jgi:hypothetical protein